MAVIAVIVLLLLGGLMMQSRSLERRLAVYDAKAASLEQEIADEKERTEDIEKLNEAGIPAVVFGKAIYEGRIDMKKLWDWQNG